MLIEDFTQLDWHRLTCHFLWIPVVSTGSKENSYGFNRSVKSASDFPFGKAQLTLKQKALLFHYGLIVLNVVLVLLKELINV